MKASDLVVGQHYLMSTGNDWETDAYRCSRVVVLDTGQWTTPGWSYGRSQAEAQPTEKMTVNGTEWEVSDKRATHRGSGVLVGYVEGYGGFGLRKPPRASIVNTRYIRGPWDETKAMVDQRVRRREQARVERERQRDEDHARAVANHQRLLAILPDAVTHPPYGRDLPVDRRDLERLLTLAEVGRAAVLLDTASDDEQHRAQVALDHALADYAVAQA